jgi:DnaJ like chaperone protein
MNIPSDSQAAFLVCTFSMLGKLAEADGNVSKDEVEKVREYIRNKLNLNTKAEQLALKVFRDASCSPLELRDYAEQFNKSYKHRVKLHDQMIEILVELSLSDGRLSPNEDRLIRSAALLLGLTEAGYERIKNSKTKPEEFL